MTRAAPPRCEVRRMMVMNWTIASWAIFAAALAWPGWFAGRRLLRRMRRRRRCEMCSYDLRGRVSDRCPECGHDVTQSLRLIRVRAVLLHGAIMVALLTASHLVNHIEAIQKRGWIAAVPTTVLILFVPFDDRPAGVDRSIAARELLEYRIVDPLVGYGGFGFRDQGPALPPRDWQWWLAVELALSCDFVTHNQRTQWMEVAESILISAARCEQLSSGQMERVLRAAFLNVHTRPQWPLGVDVHARFGYLGGGIGRWAGLDYVARPCDENASLTPFDVSVQEACVISADWCDCRMSLGKPRSIGPVEYQFIAWREDSSADAWAEIHREVKVITAVVPADTEIMQPISIDDEIIAGIGVEIQIWNHAIFGSPQCAVLVNLSANERLIDAVDSGTMAVRILLKHDGQTVAERSAWWSNRMGWAPRGQDEWKLDMVVDHDLLNRARHAGDELWTIVIEGDPSVALRDFESTSYWAGRHEFRNIPVEREGSEP